jgi:hypothetical protein
MYQEVQGLFRMTVKDLREKYLEVFGEETRSHHKEFLRRRIAWRLQALAEGDLSERARKRAEELANDADLRIRIPRDSARSAARAIRERSATGRLSTSRDPRLPPPGSFLTRKFKGLDIVVKVLDHGFEYDGRRFKSLSSIAQEVTGSKWNGFAFFLLTESSLSQRHGGINERL